MSFMSSSQFGKPAPLPTKFAGGGLMNKPAPMPTNLPTKPGFQGSKPAPMPSKMPTKPSVGGFQSKIMGGR